MTDLTELLRSAEPLTEPGFDAHDVARRVQQRARRRALATTTAVVVGMIAVLGGGPVDMWRRPPTSVVLSPPTAPPFVGTWVSTDTDGSSQTMEIVRAGGDQYEVVARDEAATAACSGAPSTMTGAGRLESDERLVIAQPELTCDDGTTPAIGPPPQAELANFTLDLDTATDVLVDPFGVVWQQRGVVGFPNLTTTFVSPRNGFSIKHPDRVALTPAKPLWGFNEQPDDGFDVVETGLAAVFKGASTVIPNVENSVDEWIDDYVSDDEYVSPGSCGVPRSQQAEITIDGRSGRISECPNQIEATVVAGGRLYLFTLLHSRSDARAVFNAFAATIDLTPETAVDVPALTTTFVSPTYGYSFKYLDRGGLAPATELWDPVNQSPVNDLGSASARYLDQFDTVETGLAAFFMSASTEIPDGVSIDGWVDAAVTKYLPAGCYAPRGQQEEITIDGHSGRISEDCPDEIVATVVVDGRLYLFMQGHSRSDGRAFFDAFAATIDLRPKAAAVP